MKGLVPMQLSRHPLYLGFLLFILNVIIEELTMEQETAFYFLKYFNVQMPSGLEPCKLIHIRNKFLIMQQLLAWKYMKFFFCHISFIHKAV